MDSAGYRPFPRQLKQPAPRPRDFVESSPAINELRNTIRQLEGEIQQLQRRVERFDEDLSGDPRYGRVGLFKQIASLREEHKRLEKIVEGFERNEQERREELAGDLAKRGRAINLMFGFISTVLSGFVLATLVYYFLGA